MKYFISVAAIIIFLQCNLAAQRAVLKQPLSKEIFLDLDEQVKSCLAYNANINFTFHSSDFFDNKNSRGDQPNSQSQINELKKQLKGNYRDAGVYNKIGMVYKGLQKQDEADKNFYKALELSKEYVKNNPDSSLAYDMLASVYVNLSKFTEAIKEFHYAYNIDKKDSLARYMIPFCHMFMGNFKEAFTAVNTMLLEQPDEFDLYTNLTVINYWSKLFTLQQLPPAEFEQLLRNKTPEEIFDLTKIKDAYNRNNKKAEFELLYQFSRHLAICTKSFFRMLADSSSSSKNIKFKLEEKDITELVTIKAFYEKCLTDSRIPNKFILHKSIGNIYLLLGEAKNALPFLKTAIKLKPLKKSKYDDNAAEDYDNLAAAFFILTDTLSYEKTIKEKLIAKPAINPLAADYAAMAKIAFFHKDYAGAKKYSEDALKINPKLADAHICLVAIDILNRNIKDAMKKIDILYEVDHNRYEFYILQGICLIHENDVSTAYSSFKMAKTLVNKPAWIDDEILGRYFIIN